MTLRPAPTIPLRSAPTTPRLSASRQDEIGAVPAPDAISLQEPIQDPAPVRPTSLEHLKPPTKVKDKSGTSPKFSPRLFRKLQVVKTGMSFVNNLKLPD